MESQLTLRLPRDLARELARAAKARGLKKSQVVREAVAEYLARRQEETPEQRWERVKHFVGSVELDYEKLMADPIARQMYEHNFRD
jgi:metal-responsive CopG/Arc/MetJ family transcriptional regulator